MTDLTRWNRAGLSRFEYVDGNAAVFLERLRAGLNSAFPNWAQAQMSIPAGETEDAKKTRLETLYAADPDDMLWQLTRQFARSCHVLASHIDAYGNEATLGTASQWENLRRLVALLDYAPIPQASAATPIALLLKADRSGTVKAGLQLKYSPSSGAPLIFESLTDLETDAAWNILYAKNHDQNPHTLSGTTLVLEGRYDKIKSGEPIVLENEDNGQITAHRVDGVTLSDTSTTLTVFPSLPTSYRIGHLTVHASPKEKAKPLGPASGGVDSVGHSLQLAAGSDGLAAGDIVMIRAGDDKPYYRRVKTVHDDRLVFYLAIGRLTLTGCTVAQPVTVPISSLDQPKINRVIKGDGTVIDVVYVAGDWSRLTGEWLADIRYVEDREYLPMYLCEKANYMPVTSESTQTGYRAGYTALTLAWHTDTDGVDAELDFELSNPQTLLAPPPAAGAWTVDTFLNRSASGRLETGLVTAQCKHIAASDFAVVMQGSQMAWARLASVALDAENEESTLSAESVWQHRGGGPFFLSRTRVYGHFLTQAKVADWQVNDTPLSGDEITLDSLKSGMKLGRALLVDNGSSVLETSLVDQDVASATITLADALPEGTTAGNLMIYANVIDVGHGETRSTRVLGSGDGTRNNQQFTLEVADLAFVADASMSSGVSAALTVTVGNETWTQVATLKDSDPSDAHYQVRLDEDGYASIQFGDGRHGRRLPSGSNNVRMSFRQGAGDSGNIEAQSLTKPLKPHPLVESVYQPIAATGGADRESNADLRENAPATLLALDRAVSLDDYAQLARAHASIWQACALRLPPGSGLRERIQVVVMAAGGGELSSSLRDEIASYLAERAQPGVNITVSDFTPLAFALDVTVRVRTDAYDKQTVQDAVAAALETAFSKQTRKLGQPLYRGEVYKVVDGVEGVENSDCSIDLTITPASALSRITQTGSQVLLAQPAVSQCLYLDIEHCKITVAEYQL